MSVIPSPISSTTREPSEPGQLLDQSTLRGRSVYQVCKRVCDVVLALVLGVLLLPLWVFVALLIRSDSPGPVLFVIRAVGQNGREFLLYKFRSMHPLRRPDAERADVVENLLHRAPTTFIDGKPVYKTALVDATRITRIGRFLRQTSLDEFPQLWNILRGDLSFVGPRPSLPDEVALYEEWQKQRLLVPQGLTGLYQVTARNRVPIEEMIRIDLDYIRNRSFCLDLKILCKTPYAMLSGL
jgi:lipopolysaccharide/colanic/teichoic acid biosynthesis glycosyltransferase